MHITWKGQTCFRISVPRKKDGNPVDVLIDPFLEKGARASSKEADILIVDDCHYDGIKDKNIKYETFLITGPGEYEIKEISIEGIPFLSSSKGEDSANLQASEDKASGKGKKSLKQKEETGKISAFYVIEAEGIRICHLGRINCEELDPEQLEKIGEVDILMVPVGGGSVIDGIQASKIVNQIEPKIVIPMCYRTSKSDQKLDKVDKFLKAVGVEPPEVQSKLLIRERDLPKGERKIVILES